MKKKILVTGGAGFIGVNLIEYLRKKIQYAEIEVLDNFNSNVVDEKYFMNQNIKCDRRDLKELLDLKDFPKYDYIIHLAAEVGPLGVLKYAGKMGFNTIDNLKAVIHFCKISGSRLIVASTSEVYGNPGVLSETTPCEFRGPIPTVRNEYAIAKLLSEVILYNLVLNESWLKFQIIRPFNIAGKYQSPEGGFVIPRFAIQALKDDEITVYGSGKQERAFTYINDICEAIYLIMFAPEEHWNQTWNVGNQSNRTSILDLAKEVVNCVGKGKIINIDPKRLHGEIFDEAPDKIPDTFKIEKLLGWKPTLGYKEVIKEVVDYWKEEDRYKSVELK